MSAELLRRAAASMRSTAGAAIAATDEWPWIAEPHPARRDSVTVQSRSGKFLAHYCVPDFADHAVSWHPAVALAVAEWLEHAAARAESKIKHGGKADPVWSHEHDALAVARAYLGEAS